MVTDSYAFFTGLFLILLTLATALSAFYLGDYGREYNHYIISTTGSVSGLTPDSEVIFRGVEAGKVKSIIFDPENSRNILVHLDLNKDLPITLGTYATLRTQPLTGISEVDLDDRGDNREPLNTSDDHPSYIPIEPSFLDAAKKSSQQILDQTSEVARRLNILLGDNNLVLFENGLASLDKVLADLVIIERQVSSTLHQFASTEKKLNQAIKDHSTAAKSVNDTSGRIGRLTQDLSESFHNSKEATAAEIPEIKAMIHVLDEVLQNLQRLSSSIERDPQILLLGNKPNRPGPGEPGFKEPK